MAEFNRISKKFFSKCVAASGARFELDAEELWVFERFRTIIVGTNIVKTLEKVVNTIN